MNAQLLIQTADHVVVTQIQVTFPLVMQFSEAANNFS